MRYSTGLCLIILTATLAAATLRDPVWLSGYRLGRDPGRPTLTALVFEKLGLRLDPWGRSPWSLSGLRCTAEAPYEDRLSGGTAPKMIPNGSSSRIEKEVLSGESDPWRREPTLLDPQPNLK